MSFCQRQMPCKYILLRRRHTSGRWLSGLSCPYPIKKLVENCIFFTIWKQRPAFRIKVTSCLLRRPSTEQWVWGFKQEGPVREEGCQRASVWVGVAAPASVSVTVAHPRQRECFQVKSVYEGWGFHWALCAWLYHTLSLSIPMFTDTFSLLTDMLLIMAQKDGGLAVRFMG